MKGALHKTEQGWVIRWDREDHRDPVDELPLHPNDVEYIKTYEDNYYDDTHLHPAFYQGKKVEFDWCVIIDNNTGKSVQYSKLIKPEIPRLMYRGGKEIRSYHSPKIDEMLKEIEEEMSDDKNICEYSGLRSVTSYTETKETLYTEEQVREAIRMSRVTNTTNVIGGGVKLHTYSDNEIIQSLKQPKQ